MPSGHIEEAICWMRVFAKISLAFSLEGQILEPPAESWVGSAMHALDTMRREDLTVVVVVVVERSFATVVAVEVCIVDGDDGMVI